ncbi:hypothetical protein M3Y97_00665400 [Aphelenchoides bicaudatus]|nr:hypothetical protein M3Y97_00665400 [Aphelenchoides bicaudatus]
MVVLEIFFDEDKVDYLPGDKVTGFVNVESDKFIDARNIIISCAGKSKVRFQKGSGRSRQTYSLTTIIIKENIRAWEKEDKWDKVPPGCQQYPFSFQLPKNLVPTHETPNGRIFYEIKARIDIPHWFDKKFRVAFTVLPFLDLTKLPRDFRAPFQHVEESFGFFCIDNVDIKVHLNKSGFAIGELIECTVDVQSVPNREVSALEMSFVKKMLYRAGGESKSKSETLQWAKSEIDNPSETLHYQASFRVPETITSFDIQNFCVSYKVVVRLYINGKLWNRCVDVPFKWLKVGTIPTNARSILPIDSTTQKAIQEHDSNQLLPFDFFEDL